MMTVPIAAPVTDRNPKASAQMLATIPGTCPMWMTTTMMPTMM